MTSIEDRTRTALHEAADGLLVPDSDLRRIEEHIMTLVDSGPTRSTGADLRRMRRWGWVAAAVAAVVALGGGLALWRNEQEPSRPTPATTPTVPTSAFSFDPALVGLWRNGLDGAWLWAFTADGRVAWFDTPEGLIHAGGELRPIVARQGDTYEVLQQPGDCVVGLQASVTGRDFATVRVVDHQCPGGSEEGTVADLERVSGRAATSAAMRPHFPAALPRTAESMTPMAGTWLDPATGTVLALATPSPATGQAEYLLDDNGAGLVPPDGRGRVTMTASGAVVPVSAGVGSCAPVFSGVVSDVATLTTTAGAGGCVAEGAQQTWIAVN